MDVACLGFIRVGKRRGKTCITFFKKNNSRERRVCGGRGRVHFSGNRLPKRQVGGRE